jgi:UDP-3-O-[3-hydroxymyristoyl] N-acetylglucosamine deacetylase/3-hydroxyacyl-[acyl-carrier-protein] dehydratase
LAKRAQRTLKGPVEFSGVGLHTGKEVHVRVKPAPAETGVVFVRTDLPDQPRLEARNQNLTTRDRRTCLKVRDLEIHTCEHVLAVLHGFKIDNAEIELDGEELPGLDGSALPVVELVRKVGTVEQKAARKDFPLDEPVFVTEGDSSIIALPDEGGLSIQYHLEYRTPAPVLQSVSFRIEEDVFAEQVAPARTFVMESEVEALRAMGLGKGANYSNTLVMGKDGLIDNQLRFQDEFARHKVLDIMGDLFLLGADLSAKIIATKTGHSANMQLVKKLSEMMEAREEAGLLIRESGFDIKAILKLLPHRYPFLLVDRVIELEGFQRAVGIKNVTINEPYFQGHWPGHPIMPGVLQLEAMAQLAGVLLLRKLENTGKLAVLWSIDKVKLRGAVVPGDQLRIEVETMRMKQNVGQVNARCKVAGKLVAEAQLTFTMIDG